jgi:cellulose biosynthesis protein BcsQ
MQVIVINSQKGGSAKTMLAKHLSVEAERAGDGLSGVNYSFRYF